jgi:hypothetical protein
MPSVYAANPIGSVTLQPDARTANFSLVDGDPKIPTTKGIVTGISWKDGVNVQFTHTMGDDIYMNIFGNRMGTMTVKGVAFADLGCKGASEHGIIKTIKWYRDNRVSTKQAKIIIKVGGSEAIDGFLIGASYHTDDTEHWMVNYQLEVATVPRSS